MNIDKKLADIEKLTGSENKYWICGPEAGQFLHDQVVDVNAKNVLEFGTSVGYSALWLAKALLRLSAECQGGVPRRLFTVESHKERGDIAQRNFEGLEDVVTLVRGHAPEVLEEQAHVFPESFDLIFFDATKYEHLSYFEAVYSRLRVGGVLISDNVISHGEGNMMKKFLNKIKSHPAMQSEILDIGSGLLVSVKVDWLDE